MTFQITIRNVPKETKEGLAARAALERRSMQEFLLNELNKIVARPPLPEWTESVRRAKDSSHFNVPVAEILQERDADRR